MTRRWCISGVLLAAALLPPRPVLGWGAIGHRLVARRAVDAVDALGGPLGAFARERREQIADRSLDPDLIWREECGHPEAITHFFDADLYGPDPAAIPRDLDELRARFGYVAVAKNGLLPWKIDEMARCLVRALERRDAAWAADLMGQLAHYTGDLAQPFHLTSDHDGQSTGQIGIHHRYEDGLVSARRYTLERALGRTRIEPRSVEDPIELAFGAMAHVGERVLRVLEADREASAHEPLETRAYYRGLAQRLEPALVGDLAAGARMTAEIWLWAWSEAGQPELPTAVSGAAAGAAQKSKRVKSSAGHGRRWKRR